MFTNRRNLLLAGTASLAVCSVAQANSIAPFVWFWPGVLHVAFFYSFPATLLAAVIEGDFVRRSGERKGNRVLSLRANLLSTLVGILLTPLARIAVYSGPAAMLCWCLAAFAISCVVEVAYVKHVDRRIQAARLVLGNGISATTLMVVPWIAEAVKEARFEWAWNLRPHENEMLWIAFIVSAAILAVAWFLPVRRGNEVPPSQRQKTGEEGKPATAEKSEAPVEAHLASSK
ncbi:MAG TPA: hypothetical protein VGN57_15175 [Pirellulaceae bacterium]|jgi:hypothetical protein|nr:hypothetical protein [Pirellulaceae bacterium]